MRRVRTVVSALLLALAGSLAHGFDFPPEAEFIVTDADGIIVAHGRATDGTSVDMEVWSGFEGLAQLTWFLPDGATLAIEVAIEDGLVSVDGVDLRTLLAATFERVVVRFVDPQSADADPSDGAADGASGGRAPGIGTEGEPPGQDVRPDEPPGQDVRPDEPPGQERRPDEPPGRSDPQSNTLPQERRR